MFSSQHTVKHSSNICSNYSAALSFLWKWKLLSHVRFFAPPWTIQSMELSRSEYWSGSLSLLQGMFPTQESNRGLLHCRQILYQLNYQEAPKYLCPWNSPGQNTGVGSCSLRQGIFPTQGSNPGLLHCRWILYQMSHKGSPRMLGWVAYPFSRGSFQPRNRTEVSCIALQADPLPAELSVKSFFVFFVPTIFLPCLALGSKASRGRDFLAGPEVKTPAFQCMMHRFDP